MTEPLRCTWLDPDTGGRCLADADHHGAHLTADAIRLDPYPTPDDPCCAARHDAGYLCELNAGHVGPHLALQHNDPPVTWDG